MRQWDYVRFLILIKRELTIYPLPHFSEFSTFKGVISKSDWERHVGTPPRIGFAVPFTQRLTWTRQPLVLWVSPHIITSLSLDPLWSPTATVRLAKKPLASLRLSLMHAGIFIGLCFVVLFGAQMGERKFPCEIYIHIGFVRSQEISARALWSARNSQDPA